mmetsp:Transcript_22951/g.63941  ORF Transcript_22951/g.63941 Transcript_22951/m.63941 type:complete len:242 (-) Transcript_22951:1451-2176(-)
MARIPPVVKAGLQSGTIMCIADIMTQKMIADGSAADDVGSSEKIEAQQPADRIIPTSSIPMLQSANEQLQSLDQFRTIQWTAAGLLLHGPFLHFGFIMLDKYFPLPPPSATSSQQMRAVLKKTMGGQVFVFPPYLLALFTYLAVTDYFLDALLPTQTQTQSSTTTTTLSQAVAQRIQTKVPEALMAGCVFWPVVNSFNFTFIAPAYRVLYTAAVGSTWNVYLNWHNSQRRGNRSSVVQLEG